jgi:hypothetical protein
MGETALWGRPPYGGNRPQRGFIRRLLRGYNGGNPPPTRFYKEAIERLLRYLYYHYDVLKRNQVFLKIEN